MPRTRNPYPAEIREQLVELARASRSVESLAQEHGPMWRKPSATPGKLGDANTWADANETAAPPDLSRYDLTVGEALEVFREASHKLPSIRTLQRYCQEGRFDSYKLKTTRNGNPVHAWIINSTSLRALGP